MNNTQYENSNAIVFESNDKALAVELLSSSTDFTTSDIRAFANVGAISQEDAQKLMSKMENSAVKLDKCMKTKVLQRKALIVLAKEKNDPLIQELVDLREKQEIIYATLEEKYGEEARLNQGSLIGKLFSKFRNKKEAVIIEMCGKISEFN